MSAVVESLTIAKRETTRFQDRVGKAPAGMGVAMLMASKAQADGYACAAEALDPFLGSADRFVALTSSALGLAYDALAEACRALDKEYVALLDADSAGEPPGVGTALDRLATRGRAVEEAWRDVFQAALLSTNALPLFTEDGRATGRLRLTRAQRARLRAALEPLFDASRNADDKGDRLMLEQAARALHEFLGRREWRSSDDR